MTNANASKVHIGTQKSEYVQPENFDEDDMLFSDIFDGEPGFGDNESSNWRQKEVDTKQAEEAERKVIEQQQNCTIVAGFNEALLTQLGCHSETFDIAEEDCYQEWITVWHKGNHQLEIIQNGYWYIVPK